MNETTWNERRPRSTYAGCGPGSTRSRRCAGYLDDLFVEPAMRGTGVVEALFAAIDATAAEHGWSIVRWRTADDNYRARTAYDRVATRTGWITYEMATGA